MEEKVREVQPDEGIAFQSNAKYIEIKLEDPIQVDSGSRLSIMAKTKCPGHSNRYYYGYDGYDNYVDKIEGQEQGLFKFQYSDFNQNSTDTGYG